MKKFLVIIVLTFLFSTNAFSKIGKGNLNINDQTLNYLIEYLRNEFSTSFIISKNGNKGYYGLCHSGKCMGGDGATSTLLKRCKKETGDKCSIFAQTKNKKKVIRWNKIDYTFPEGDFYYVESYTPDSNGEGIKKNITDDQIKSVLSQFGFITFNKVVASIDVNNNKSNKPTNNIGGEHFCIWTGTGEYTDLIWFALNSHYNKISKQFGSKNPDCRKKAIYIVYKEKNNKLFKKLMWKFKNRSNPDNDNQSRLSKNLYKKVQNEIVKNTEDFEQEIIELNKSIEVKITPKKEEKLTKQKQIEIDQIKEMFDIGALTKDEYDAAIKRALN